MRGRHDTRRVPLGDERHASDDPALERQLAEFERFATLADAMRADIRVVMVRIVGRATSRAVAVFFHHDDFPDVFFAYRPVLATGTDPHEGVWLAEELATGGLHQMMRRGEPAADVDGVVWLRLRGSTLVAELGFEAPR